MSSSPTRSSRVSFSSLSSADKKLALLAIQIADMIVKDMKRLERMSLATERDIRLALVKSTFNRLKQQSKS